MSLINLKSDLRYVAVIAEPCATSGYIGRHLTVLSLRVSSNCIADAYATKHTLCLPYLSIYHTNTTKMRWYFTDKYTESNPPTHDRNVVNRKHGQLHWWKNTANDYFDNVFRAIYGIIQFKLHMNSTISTRAKSYPHNGLQWPSPLDVHIYDSMHFRVLLNTS